MSDGVSRRWDSMRIKRRLPRAGRVAPPRLAIGLGAPRHWENFFPICAFALRKSWTWVRNSSRFIRKRE